MKIGRTLTDLAAEIERQQTVKRDFIAPTNKIGLVVEDGDVKMDLGADMVYPINDLAHTQIAEYSKIPKPYYDRMRAEVPELLTQNIRTWFDKKPQQRMVRTLDHRDRAFLSDGFRPLENYDLAEAVLPTLLDNQLEIMSCEITEKRLYIKAVDRRITRDVPTGRKMGDGSNVFFDTLSPAIIVSNSEVGFGRLSVDAGIYTRVCTNMCMVAKGGMKRTHIGGKHALSDSVENIDALLTSETRKATDKAIWLQVRDVVKAAFDEQVFAARCDALKVLTEDRIEGDVVKTVELSAKKYGLSDLIKGGIQKHLIEGGDLTRYGLFNAITRTAQDQESYDTATELEALGGKIIELGRQEWRELAKAA
jgi:hypothetical protein